MSKVLFLIINMPEKLGIISPKLTISETNQCYHSNQSIVVSNSALHCLTDPIRYVSSILSIDIRYVSRYFPHYHQIGLKPTEICDVERSFPGVNFMI